MQTSGHAGGGKGRPARYDRAQTPEEIAEAIGRIEDKVGVGNLTPDAVVEAARPKAHPLHHRFEWDDSVAGHKYRLDQARALIRTRFAVVTEIHTIRAPAFVRDPNAGVHEQGYRSIGAIRDVRADALAVMRRELLFASSAVQRAIAVAGVLGLAEDLAGLLERLEALRRQVEQDTTPRR